MTTTSAKWLLLGGMVLSLVGGGAVLLAAPGDKPPVRELIKAPVPKEKVMEWKEAEAIEFTDGGRVTSIAFAPSGKTFAVCRADGKIDFFDPATRKHQQSMNFLGGPKDNPNREGGTVPTVAFRPRPHAKLGDVFAITHKNGVNFGTTNIGLLVDDAPAVDDLPANWVAKDFDPHQVVWLTDTDGTTRLVATNGEETRYRRVGLKGLPVEGASFAGWKEYRQQPAPLAAAPGAEAVFCRFNNEKWDAADVFDMWRIEPLGDASNPNQWRRISGHKARPTCAAVAADGKRIVSADEKGTLIVWDGETFKEKSRIELGDGVVQLALAPDGKTAAVVRAFVDTRLFGQSGRTLFNLELFVFDVTDPPAKPKPLWAARNVLADKKEFTGPVSLAFSPDGTTLLAAFADPYTDNPKERGAVPKSMGVKVWTLGGAKAKAPVPKQADSEWKEGNAIELADDRPVTGLSVSPDGKLLAVTQHGRVELIEADSRKRRFALEEVEPPTVTAVAFNPKGDKIAVTGKDHVLLRGVESNQAGETWEVKGFDPHQVTWFTDKEGDEHIVATNGTETRHRDATGKEGAWAGWAVFKHQPCLLAGVPGKGGWLMQFDNENDPRGTADFWLWNPTDVKKCQKLTGHKHRPEFGAVSGDGKVIVTGDGAGHVVVWDGDTGEKKAAVVVEGGVLAVAITADGKTTAVIGGVAHAPKGAVPGGKPDTANVTTDLTVAVYDTAELAKADKAAQKPLYTWKTDSPLAGGRRGPASLAFSPDGKTLYAAFADPYLPPQQPGDVPGTGSIPKSMGVKVWELVPKK